MFVRFSFIGNGPRQDLPDKHRPFVSSTSMQGGGPHSFRSRFVSSYVRPFRHLGPLALSRVQLIIPTFVKLISKFNFLFCSSRECPFPLHFRRIHSFALTRWTSATSVCVSTAITNDRRRPIRQTPAKSKLAAVAARQYFDRFTMCDYTRKSA